tara:strand:- start:731 stop:952 length:222 start_codon:yes stop_codon:yes gene_type:complete
MLPGSQVVYFFLIVKVYVTHPKFISFIIIQITPSTTIPSTSRTVMPGIGNHIFMALGTLRFAGIVAGFNNIKV